MLLVVSSVITKFTADAAWPEKLPLASISQTLPMITSPVVPSNRATEVFTEEAGPVTKVMFYSFSLLVLNVVISKLKDGILRKS
jgi:hypothetical protein